MKFLVTGASGFVGRTLCRVLRDGGQEVRTAIRAGGTDLNGLGAVQVGAIDADTDWAAALKGVDVVVHLASRVHVMHEEASEPLAEYRKINVEGTINLARQAILSGVKRFIFISSIKVNGESTTANHAFSESDDASPQDPYALSKLEAEVGLQKIASGSGMAYVIIRPPLIYGVGVKANFAALLRYVESGWPIPLGLVKNRRSFVAIDNLVDFIVLCASHTRAENQIFLVSDGRDLSTPALLRCMADAMSKPLRLVNVPIWLLRFFAAAFGRLAVVDRLCGNLQVSTKKAASLLGWIPPVSVEEGLRRTISSLEEQ